MTMPVRKTLILTGDSNSAGFQPTLVPQIYPNAARIFSLNNALQVIPAADPLVPGLNFTVGPGIAAADEYLTRCGDPTMEILIVSRLCGPPTSLKMSDLQLGQIGYQNLCSAALYATQNWGPAVGLMMVEGLHDCSVFEEAFEWPILARRFRENLRVHLGAQIPFTCNGFAAKPANPYPYFDLVQLGISKFGFDDPRTTFIDCSHFATNDPVTDPLHFTAASQVAIGRLNGAALEAIIA